MTVDGWVTSTSLILVGMFCCYAIVGAENAVAKASFEEQKRLL